MSLRSFFGLKAAGSRIFRKVLTSKNKSKVTQLTQYKTYCKLTENEEISEIRAREIFSDWNAIGGSSHFKVFLFKQCNNILGLNQRVSKFNREIEPTCTFCNAAKKFLAPLETFSHIFFFCKVINPIVRQICSDLLVNNDVNVKKIFSGEICKNNDYIRAFSLIMNSLRYCIWQFKLEKRIPSNNLVRHELFYTVKNIRNSSAIYRLLIDRCQLFRQHGE